MTQTDLDIDQANRLIASNRVEGTTVYNRQGEKIGSVHHFMVDKRSGRAEYAVLSFGGLFGLGQDHYPLPWDMLTYDTDKSGYVVDFDKNMLEKAPRYPSDEQPSYDHDYGRSVYTYYGLIFPY